MNFSVTDTDIVGKRKPRSPNRRENFWENSDVPDGCGVSGYKPDKADFVTRQWEMNEW